MAKKLTIEGVEYKSATKAAVALVAAGKTITEAAAILGVTYQTVYVATIGAANVKPRRDMYRVLGFAKRGKKSVGEIATKTGLSTSKIIALLKKNGIVVLTKEAKAAKVAAKAEAKAEAKAAAKAAKVAEKAAKNAAKAPKKAAKNAAKAPKKAKIVEETLPIDPQVPAEEFADVNEAMNDELAQQAALADMPTA